MDQPAGTAHPTLVLTVTFVFGRFLSLRSPSLQALRERAVACCGFLQEIHLQDLSPAEAQQMVESLLRTKAIPSESKPLLSEAGFPLKNPAGMTDQGSLLWHKPALASPGGRIALIGLRLARNGGRVCGESRQDAAGCGIGCSGAAESGHEGSWRIRRRCGCKAATAFAMPCRN